MTTPPEHRAPAAPPRGVIWAGYACAVLALLFFIVLTLLPSFGHPLRCEQRFPAVVVLALAAALATGFIGGSASASGQLAFARNVSPIKFGVAGGIAVLVILLVLGHVLWAKDCRETTTGTTEYSMKVPEGQTLKQALDAFERMADVTINTPDCTAAILGAPVRSAEIRGRTKVVWLTELTYRVRAPGSTITVKEVVRDREYQLLCK